MVGVGLFTAIVVVLQVIATALGINADGAHRAMADVRMTEKVLYRFLREFINGGVNTLEELQTYQTKKHGLVVLGQKTML